MASCPLVVNAARASSYGVSTPEQDNDKTNVEPVHSYDAFHTRHVGPGVKGIIGIYRFNICLIVVLLSCSGVKTPSGWVWLAFTYWFWGDLDMARSKYC